MNELQPVLENIKNLARLRALIEVQLMTAAQLAEEIARLERLLDIK